MLLASGESTGKEDTFHAPQTVLGHGNAYSESDWTSVGQPLIHPCM